MRNRFAGRGVRAGAGHEDGQTSLEYLLVGLVLLAMIGALGALWHYASQGDMVALADQGASHAAETTGGVLDALAF